jgi:hypothetical protein
MASISASAASQTKPEDIRQLVINGDDTIFRTHIASKGFVFLDLACGYLADLIDIVCCPADQRKIQRTEGHLSIYWELVYHITSSSFNGDRALIKAAVQTAANHDHDQTVAIILDHLEVTCGTFGDYFAPSDFVEHASKGNLQIVKLMHMCHPEVPGSAFETEAFDKLDPEVKTDFVFKLKIGVKYRCQDYLGILSQRLRTEIVSS